VPVRCNEKKNDIMIQVYVVCTVKKIL